MREFEKEKLIGEKIDVAFDIYFDLMEKTKKRMESIFGKPNSYYDLEKKFIAEVANNIFNKVIDDEALKILISLKDKFNVEEISLELDMEDVTDGQHASSPIKINNES